MFAKKNLSGELLNPFVVISLVTVYRYDVNLHFSGTV